MNIKYYDIVFKIITLLRVDYGAKSMLECSKNLS